VFYFSDFGFDWAQKSVKRAGNEEEIFFIKTISCIFVFVCLKNKTFEQKKRLIVFFANVSRIFQSSLLRNEISKEKFISDKDFTLKHIIQVLSLKKVSFSKLIGI